VVRPTEIESRRKDGLDDGVQARSITDGELRGVVWGDPMAHTMKLYKRRIEVLATAAVVGGGWRRELGTLEVTIYILHHGYNE
jgi:hypothetical protein